MHLNNSKAVFFWHVSSLVEAFNQSRKCIESIVTNIITFTLIHLGYCWSMLYSYYKEQFANILGGNNYLGLLSKLTQHQICKLAILENRRPRTWSHYGLTNFPADLLVRGYLKKQKRRFLPCYSSKISCSYLSFDVLPLISPLIWLMESTPPESRTCVALRFQGGKTYWACVNFFAQIPWPGLKKWRDFKYFIA